MKHAEKAAPVAAIVTALATLGCCLPFGIAGLLGTAGLVMAVRLRPWLLALAAVLLGVGFYQLHQRRRACACGSASTVLLVLSAVIVAVVAVFQEKIAVLVSRWP
jgi:hypothetical protein